MPALRISCYNGRAFVLVNSGAIIVEEYYTNVSRVFADAVIPKMLSSTHQEITSDEFKAIPWERIDSSTVQFSDPAYLEVIISGRGIDLSADARSVALIALHIKDATPLKRNNWLVPRMKWLAKYAGIMAMQERTTAVAMATHKRLGGESPLACLNKDTIQMVMALTLE